MIGVYVNMLWSYDWTTDVYTGTFTMCYFSKVLELAVNSLLKSGYSL